MKTFLASCLIAAAAAAQPFSFHSPAIRGNANTAAGSSSAVAVDLIYTGEGSAGQISLAGMSNQTIVATVGTFSSSGGNPNTNAYFATAAQLANLPATVSCNGTNFDGSGTTGFNLDLTYTSSTDLTYVFPSDKSEVKVGFFFNCNPGGISTTLSFATLQLLTSDYCACQWRNSLGSPNHFWIRAHSAPGTGVGANIEACTNITYWVVMRAIQGQACELSAWTWTNSAWKWVGYSSNSMANNPIHSFSTPNVANGGTTAGWHIWSDNFVFDWTTPTAVDTNSIWP